MSGGPWPLKCASLCFRQAWQLLGELSRDEAMQQFIQQLDSLCPLFSAYVEAHKAEKEEQEQRE